MVMFLMVTMGDGLDDGSDGLMMVVVVVMVMDGGW